MGFPKRGIDTVQEMHIVDENGVSDVKDMLAYVHQELRKYQKSEQV